MENLRNSQSSKMSWIMKLKSWFWSRSLQFLVTLGTIVLVFTVSAAMTVVLVLQINSQVVSDFDDLQDTTNFGEFEDQVDKVLTDLEPFGFGRGQNEIRLTRSLLEAQQLAVEVGQTLEPGSESHARLLDFVQRKTNAQSLTPVWAILTNHFWVHVFLFSGLMLLGLAYKWTLEP